MHAEDGRHHAGSDLQLQREDIEDRIDPQHHQAGEQGLAALTRAARRAQPEQRGERQQAGEGDAEAEHQEGERRGMRQAPFRGDGPAAPEQDEEAGAG